MYDAIVIGAGIAGSSSAILLSSLGHNVLQIEKSSLPAHKLCGEFLSIEAGSMLSRLGVLDNALINGAQAVTNILITSPSGRAWIGTLPGTALGFSRYQLDNLLFERAAAALAHQRTGVTVLGVSGGLQQGFVVSTTAGEFEARIVVGAFGKKGVPGGSAPHSHGTPSSGYVAFKQHYSGLLPSGSIEMHLFDHGYCGINSVEDGAINVCWLAQRSLLKQHGGSREAVMQYMMRRNGRLSDRLSALQPIDGTLCAIGGIPLAGKGQFENDICLIGDASQMISPFCGDGMSMALRSSELAAPLCSAFLSGKISSGELIKTYTHDWNAEFSHRIALGKALQAIALSPAGSEAALALLGLFPSVARYMVRHTRGSPEPA